MGYEVRSVNSELMFSSETDQWSTPKYFFDKVNAVFNFETDVCADHENAKCAKYFSVIENGLEMKWGGVCWMNPPYGRGIEAWVKKAYESAKQGATVVCLLPARTDTIWWNDYCAHGEVLFLKGRLKFGSAVNSAPFPSALVVFRPSLKDLNLLGMLV